MADSLHAMRLLLGSAHWSRGALTRRQRLCIDCLSRSTRIVRRPWSAFALRTNGETRHALKRRARAAFVAQSRALATVHDATLDVAGPIDEYDERVYNGRLTNDDHQRMVIQSLQDLHEMLLDYTPPKVVLPSLEELQPQKSSFLGSLFHRKSSRGGPRLPKNLPKGLYMYGDVGSGKTMLMDLFYDTLPPNIKRKTRIHFHNFMQDVHKRLHKLAMEHGNTLDGIPYVSAEIAQESTVLCFDEFQCTDVADAMILRRLIEYLMSHGTVIVTTSNRHPKDLYKNGIQRESFIPAINLLLAQLRVINLDSTTDYRKIPKPPSGVYHHPLDQGAKSHADKWFRFLGDVENDPPHPAKHHVWGREIEVPLASGSCARFTFKEIIGRATGAADYLELMRSYNAFVITDVPGMTYRERDWARRFITFIDAVYESRAKLVLTSAVPLTQLFMSREELEEAVNSSKRNSDSGAAQGGSGGGDESEATGQPASEHNDVDDKMRMLMDDLGMSMAALRGSNMFTGDEERFAFARALSRLSEMGTQDWVERGLGLETMGGEKERDSWQRVRSRWREDSL